MSRAQELLFRQQAEKELVSLPLRKRLPIYLGGVRSCECWIKRRVSALLAESIDNQMEMDDSDEYDEMLGRK
jgi:hypothetical protein